MKMCILKVLYECGIESETFRILHHTFNKEIKGFLI